MRSIILILATTVVFSGVCLAQTKPKPKPAAKTPAKPATKPASKSTANSSSKSTSKPAAKSAAKTSAKSSTKPAAKTTAKPSAKAPVKPVVDMGKLVFRTYRNQTFGFSITFPDNWLIHEGDVEKQPVAVDLKAPESLPLSVKAEISQAIKRVHVLLTAYLLTPVSEENAVVRISVEDLSANPQIKDAVDYFDAIRAMYGAMKLPANFKYSDTQVEKLGVNQFGFLDTTSSAGKRRMYVTVRKGFAVMFTVSYEREDDLSALRRVLGKGDFGVK